VEVPSKPRTLGYQASADLGVQRRRHRGRRARAMQAAPLGGQCGGRRTPSAPLALEARGQMQGRLVLAHSRDGPRPRVGQERQRLPLRGVFLQAGARVLACRSVAPAQRGGLRNGPREVGVPDVFAGRAHACARRCLGTRAQATRGANRLPRRKAGKGVPVIEQHEAEELADTWDGLQQIQRVSVRCWAAWTRESAPALSRGSSEVLRATSTARLLGTAGAAQRAATPSRVAVEALCGPISGP
jgi:hypothetical protein